MKNLLRIVIVVACAAFVVAAEDFWLKKPYTEWSEKDANKLLQNSPWAHEVSIGSPGGESPGGGGGRGRGGRGGGGGEMGGGGGEMGGGGGMSGGGMSGGGGGGEMGGTGRGGRGESMGDVGGGQSSTQMLIRIRWESATPIREALVLTRLGREKADSDDAKKFLGQTVPSYVIAIVGLPPQTMQLRPEAYAALAKSATLVRKDKDPIQAENATARDRVVYFLFPRTSPITLEDKEVEFVSKLGRLEVRRKFKLKDMMIGEKLEL